MTVNGIQIFNSADYFSKLDKLILDKSKSCDISVDDNKVHPIISKENSIVKFVNRNIKHYLSAKEFSSTFPSGSQPGKANGLTKVHKEGTPLKPVVSMLGTAEYHLAKYLVSIINKNMPNNYMLDSKFSFISQLNQITFKSTHVFPSYDVESLLTNIPLQETIENDCKHVYKQNPPKYSIEIRL